MYPLFITTRTSHRANGYSTGNARPGTRCDAGSDNPDITFLNGNITGGFNPEHRIPDNLVHTPGMFCIYRWDVCRRYSPREGKFYTIHNERPPHR